MLYILKITLYTKYCVFSVRNIRFQKFKILKKAESMLHVIICAIWQLAITFMAKKNILLGTNHSWTPCSLNWSTLV